MIPFAIDQAVQGHWIPLCAVVVAFGLVALFMMFCNWFMDRL